MFFSILTLSFKHDYKNIPIILTGTKYEIPVHLNLFHIFLQPLFELCTKSADQKYNKLKSQSIL